MFCAVRTDAFQYIIDTAQCKPLRQIHNRSGNIFKTESLVAFFTMEVCMQVVHFTGTTITAYGVLEGFCSVVNAVYEMMGQK